MAREEYEHEESDGGAGAFLLGAALGAAVGFAAGFLMAPRSGEDTRAIIVDKGHEIRERARDIGDLARERVDRAVLEGQAAARRARGRETPQFDEDYEMDLDGDAGLEEEEGYPR